MLSRPASGSEDLLLSINGTTDSLRVLAWFGSVSNRVERVEFADGSVDTLVNIENLVGSAYADRLTGDGLANRLNGGAGNDTLNGGLGADT
jgi:Ca2+-binding RTX toxin-like protein